MNGLIPMRRSIVDKRGGLWDLPTAFISGAGAFFLILIVTLIFIVQLRDANLLTSNSAEANATTQLVGNVTSGVAEVNTKIPTMFKVIAVVMLIGALMFLYLYFRSRNSKGPM